MQFCLNLNNRANIGRNEFEQINWLPVNEASNKLLAPCHLHFAITRVLHIWIMYLNGQPSTTTWASLLKLNQPLRRTNHCQNNISCIALVIWNNLPNSLKTTNNLNTYKYRIKEHFFHWIRSEANNIYSYFFLMYSHFSLLLLLFLLWLHYCCYNNYYY